MNETTKELFNKIDKIFDEYNYEDIEADKLLEALKDSISNRS